jgi:hypothetical protein
MIVVGLSGGMGQGKSTVGKILRKLAEVGPENDLENSYIISDVLNAWLAVWPKDIKREADVVDEANLLIELLPPIMTQKSGKPVAADQLKITRTEASLAANAKLLSYLKAWRLAEDVTLRFPLPIAPENKHMHRELMQWIGANAVERVDKQFWSDMMGKQLDGLAKSGAPLVTVGGIRSKGDADMIHAHKGVILEVMRAETRVDSDTTEMWNDWQPDIEIHNNGTLEQLEAAVAILWQDLQSGKTQKEYKAVA